VTSEGHSGEVRRPVWGVLLATVAGCLILTGLGTWQLKRLAWKESLIERIAERVEAPPVDLDQALRQWEETGDVEYLHVSARGRFEGRDSFYFTVGSAGPGYNVYSPLRTSGGRVLIVNRGFIPAPRLPAGDQDFSRPVDEVQVTGLARASEVPGLFTPGPPESGRRGPWLSRDLAGMASRAEIAGLAARDSLVPFFLDSDGSATPSAGAPEGGTTRLEIPNRHLEYALTWYGLAVTLAVMSALFIRSRYRLR
jgi:surfeit locus 1 family protein